MSSTSGSPSTPTGLEQRPQIATWGWALRRAAFGLLVLLVIVTLGAWLLWASIDPDEAAAAAGAPDGQQATEPQR